MTFTRRSYPVGPDPSPAASLDWRESNGKRGLRCPFLLPATTRFIAAAASLPDVRLGLISQDPEDRLRDDLRSALAGHYRVQDGTDAQQIADATRVMARHLGGVDRLLGMLEQLQVPLGEVRDALGIAGMGADVARNFRDKARMKTVFEANGVPCAGHRLARSAVEARSAAGALGYPLVAKPPAGAGARSTFRLDGDSQLEAWLSADPPGEHSPVLLEQMVVGAEHSFDSVLIDGELVWHSISRYLPTPLEVLENPWIQWAVLLPRDISGAEFDPVRADAVRGLRALGLRTGLTHMEWFRRRQRTASRSARWPRGRPEPNSRRCSRTRTTSTCTRPGRTSRSSATSRLRSAAMRSARRTCAARAAARWSGSTASTSCNASSATWSSRSTCPRQGQPSSGTYEGEGHVVLRHPETSVVEAGLRRVVEIARVELRRDVMTATVLMISPGYPAEMPFFTRGLARAGAQVIGAGDQSVSALPDMARDHLAAYWQVPSFANEEAIVHRGGAACSGHPHRSRGVAVGADNGARGAHPRGARHPGDDGRADHSVPRQGADEAGARRCGNPHATPLPVRHRCGVREAAERIGYPIIVKPIAGAGSANTYRVDSAAVLESVLPKLVWVDEVSVEEFIEASEYTYDTICAGGEVLFDNVAWYRPRPLIARQLEWISPVTLVVRDIDSTGALRRSRDGSRRPACAWISRRVHAHGVVPTRQR